MCGLRINLNIHLNYKFKERWGFVTRVTNMVSSHFDGRYCPFHSGEYPCLKFRSFHSRLPFCIYVKNSVYRATVDRADYTAVLGRETTLISLLFQVIEPFDTSVRFVFVSFPPQYPMKSVERYRTATWTHLGASPKESSVWEKWATDCR